MWASNQEGQTESPYEGTVFCPTEINGYAFVAKPPSPDVHTTLKLQPLLRKYPLATVCVPGSGLFKS